MSCSGGWTAVHRGTRSGRRDFGAQVGFSFGDSGRWFQGDLHPGFNNNSRIGIAGEVLGGRAVQRSESVQGNCWSLSDRLFNGVQFVDIVGSGVLGGRFDLFWHVIPDEGNYNVQRVTSCCWFVVGLGGVVATDCLCEGLFGR